MITFINLAIYPLLSHPNISKENTKFSNTQMAYLGLEPKSSHTIKYSQPFELVLFHVIKVRI